MDVKEAAQELLNRRGARESFKDFCDYVYPNYKSNWHTELICEKLEAVERGEIKRLIISMPPRHGKSLHASVLFPAWVMGRNKEYKIIQASYALSLAQTQSRDCRALTSEVEYENLFPNTFGKVTKTVDALKSAREFGTAAGGSYYAVGVGGGLTGRGCNILLIDDPFKDRADSDSETMRERVNDWYRSTATTRLTPDGAIVIIATRWHPDDLIGECLKKKDNRWEVLSLPAVKEGINGYDALWPDQFSAEHLALQKLESGEREWAALYLQEPVVAGGNRFNCNGIQIEDEKDFPHVNYIRCWDLASTEKQRNKNDPDFTVGMLGAVVKDKQGLQHLWIKNMVYGQWEAPKRDEMIRTVALSDGQAVHIFLEAFAAYKDTFNHMKKILHGQSRVLASRLSGDKSVKAAGLEPIFEAGNVHICKGSWNNMFRKQFMEFPSGSHDDVVDAAAIIYGESTKAKSRLMMV